MTLFIRLIIVLALNLSCFQTASAISLADACNNPVEPSLKGNTLSDIVTLENGITSHPLNREVHIVIPTSVVNGIGKSLSACIRWQPALTDTELKATVLTAIGETLNQIKLTKNQAEAVSIEIQQQIQDALSNAEKAYDTAKNIKAFADVEEAITQINAVYQEITDIKKAVASDAHGTAALKAALNTAENTAKQASLNAQQMQQGFKVWIKNLPLRVIASKDNETIVSITIPKKLSAEKPTDFWHWPTAQIRLIVTEEAANTATLVLDTVLPIKITSQLFSFIIAFVSSLIFWLICLFIANTWKIPGNPLLKVIVNKYGYASLSQFQIMLWTFVVGSSIVYVMVLTGRLINIETTILVLLGIAGASNVLAATKPTGESEETAHSPHLNNTLTQPGGVLDLQICGKSGDTQVILAWKPPVTGGTPDGYKVEYMISGTTPPTWTTVINQTTECPVTVSKLLPNIAYDFQVTALNTAGETSRTLENIKTASVAGSDPAKVQVLSLHPEQNHIMVTWTTSAASDSYIVRYRENGTGLWMIGGVANGTETNFTVNQLCFNTEYDFDVLAVTAGRKGITSNIKSEKTTWRQPTFSDLLMAQDCKEIDVSRIQMLFFTVISAFFVLLNVLDSHEIPKIPDGILLLMGISNGVYLTAKFMPQK